MRVWNGKRYWLVGASEGLGQELAFALNRAGAEVILSARSEDALVEVVAGMPGKASYQTVDIADDESVKAAAAAVGEVDGLVLLAGVYWPFGADGWDADKAVAMVDVNFTGYMRVLGQVVPDMVARNAGHIVITSSLTGFRGLPNSIGYTASKAATLSLAECMYADLRKTGIEVQVVNPGFIKTRLTDKNEFKMPFLMQPDQAAQRMFEHMGTDRFKVSFPTVFSWVFRLSQFLPDWLYFRIFGK